VSERPVPGTEGPRGHELRPPVDDRKVPWRVFVSIGLFVAVIAAIYAGTAYEGAGTVMLIVASVLALWVGSFLWLKEREQEAAGEGGHEPEALARASTAAEEAAATGRALPSSGAHYLPHASAWPFAIGLGAATLANGLVLGLWVIVPGVILMAIGIGGFVRQTRRRD
jgi:Cytochrome c oxidase subunit IV